MATERSRAWHAVRLADSVATCRLLKQQNASAANRLTSISEMKMCTADCGIGVNDPSVGFGELPRLSQNCNETLSA